MTILLRWNRATAALAVLLALSASPARSEILQLINGDTYRGTVLAMNTSNIVFQSEIQGRVILPRNKVAQIVLHDIAATHATNATKGTNSAPLILGGPPAAAPAQTGDAITEQMRQQGVDPKIISQVQEEIFGKSSPAAAAKFNDLMGGVMTGRLGLQDIRAEAQSAIRQVRAMKKELGDDAGDLLDGYVAILEKFVADSAGAGNEITPPAKPAPAANK